VLAILYLLIALLIGNLICRRIFSFGSLPHRLAASFLIGLLVCTVASYVLALVFAASQDPMLYGGIAFFALSFALLWSEFNGIRNRSIKEWAEIDTATTSRSDWIWTGIFLVLTGWLMFGTFGVSDDSLKIASFLWNDFGPNLSLVQSFAVGRNFPPEYPHFIGEPIRYHFLFWFQAANLEYLGLSIASSLNLLSTLTMTAMLVLISAFGRTVFGSRPIGWLAALLFFFHGSLAYIPFLASKATLTEMFTAVLNVSEWIPSIYKYSGEQWGVWSIGTFLAQRHLPAGIGVFLAVLVELLRKFNPESEDRSGPERSSIVPYVLCGLIIGLLPLWNGAVFVAAVCVCGSFLFIFRSRPHIISLLTAAVVVAVPQIVSLRSAGSRPFLDLFRWGYVVDPPTAANVFEYFAFTFGLKAALAGFALIVLNNFQRKVFIGFTSLLVLSFATQLSTDVMNNHKLINIWMILLNAYVAFTILLVWRKKLAGKIASILMLAAISIGGVIEMIRVWNVGDVDVPYESGAYYEWLKARTQPGDLFLTDHYVHSPILLSGRRIFYGWQYFGWSMGYPTGERDRVYKQMYTETNFTKLVQMLNQNEIRYVAFDEGLRNGHLKGKLNEAVMDRFFEKVYTDREGRYHSLVIYKVPALNALGMPHHRP